MKSYIQGLITGIIFSVSVVLFIGAKAENPIGKYQVSMAVDSDIHNIYEIIIDTSTGYVKSRTKNYHTDYKP